VFQKHTEFFEMTKDHLLGLTSEIVSAYLSNSNINIKDISTLIQEVHTTLTNIATKQTVHTASYAPAVPIDKSVTPDHIICLEDGRKLKMLKRHLKASYGLTPEQYRDRWGLPTDYPMVAPNYAKTRSNLALKTGLGKTNKKRNKNNIE
jgi:predicted transcriptional regulator